MATTDTRPIGPQGISSTDRRPDVAIRLGLVLVAVLVAAWPSLWSLAQQWRFQSALAELAIVPVLFAALLVLAARRHEYIAAARWGRADWWVATAAAVAIPAILGAARAGAENFFPTLRLDLLLLPLVAVAAIALTFGTRSLLAFAPAVGVLLLAWPLPFQAVLEQVSRVLTLATGALVGAMVDMVPIAERLPSDGDLLLRVPTADGGFEVVVSSACAGAGGMAAFLVVGIGSFAWFAGKMSRRLLWLTLGLAVVFVANAVRILAILATGRALGESAAIGLVHPLAGLISLNVAFLIMLVLARPLGLVRRPSGAKFNDNPLFGRLPGDQPADSRQVVLRITALLLGAALVGSATAALVRVGTTTDQPLATPAVEQLATLSGSITAPAGYRFADLGEQRWARPYFGSDSRWMRFEAEPVSPSQPRVWIDSIITDSVVALRSHSLIDCYRFHGYDVVVADRVQLADGNTASRYVYETADDQRWHVLAWERPVTDGERVRHERVVMMAGTAAAARLGGGGKGGAWAAAVAGEVGDPDEQLLTLAGEIAGGSR